MALRFFTTCPPTHTTLCRSMLSPGLKTGCKATIITLLVSLMVDLLHSFCSQRLGGQQGYWQTLTQDHSTDLTTPFQQMQGIQFTLPLTLLLIWMHGHNLTQMTYREQQINLSPLVSTCRLKDVTKSL